MHALENLEHLLAVRERREITREQFVALKRLIPQTVYIAASNNQKQQMASDALQQLAVQKRRQQEAERRRRHEEDRRREEEQRRYREMRRQALRDTEPGCPYKTLKAAYAAGWHDLKPEEYGGERLRLKGHTLARNTEIAVSATEWGRRGFHVLRDQEPHCWLSGRVGSRRSKTITWAVYREDQVIPKRKITLKPPEQIDVLAAVWAVNRAAKRCRDAAQSCYQAGAHAFAGSNKDKKEKYYDLKSQALNYLIADGRLQVAGRHLISGGNWAEVLKGEGYTFHRPCPPQEGEAPELDGVEAKSRDRTEPKLKDALYTLELYLAGRPAIDCYRWPEPLRIRSSRSQFWDDDDWEDGDTDESEDWDEDIWSDDLDWEDD